MSKPTNVVVKCECCCSSLEFERDIEDANTISCTLWARHNSRPLSLRERFRWSWRILRTGNPWSDHVLLNKKSVRRVLNFLKNYVEK